MNSKDIHQGACGHDASVTSHRNAANRAKAPEFRPAGDAQDQIAIRDAVPPRPTPSRVMLAAARVTTAGVEARVLAGCSVLYQDLDLALADLRADSRKAGRVWGFLAVQIDDFGGITGCIRPLLRFRHLCPSVPLILLSDCTSRDDLSCDRLALCDVTLKSPVNAASWRHALAVARKNNRTWQSRLDERAKQGRRARDRSAAPSGSGAGMFTLHRE
ncbi:hypothetical protein NHN26_11775 [Rhodovulum tesquicola]|nr:MULTISPECIES: hypothetical protein [Rhodovulum]MCO8145904.1 hypothetical protein [Rhodovulum tesquicola]